MSAPADRPARPLCVAAEEGESLWFFGGLMTLRATGEQTGGSLALTEEVRPAGTPTPLHRQPNEDETFYVLEGELTVHVDGEQRVAGPGSTVFIPRGAEHAFTVSSETARFLILNTPAGHERFFREAGEPAPRRELPPPADGPPDIERLAAIAARHGTEILGPPPFDPPG
jgi:quercetin dioxygenase-like cupin family protein